MAADAFPRPQFVQLWRSQCFATPLPALPPAYPSQTLASLRFRPAPRPNLLQWHPVLPLTPDKSGTGRKALRRSKQYTPAHRGTPIIDPSPSAVTRTWSELRCPLIFPGLLPHPRKFLFPTGHLAPLPHPPGHALFSRHRYQSRPQLQSLFFGASEARSICLSGHIRTESLESSSSKFLQFSSGVLSTYFFSVQ